MFGKVRSYVKLVFGRHPAAWIVFAILLLLSAASVRFNIMGHFEGLFLLKGGKGKLLEVKDDLYVGDGHRLIWGLDFDDPYYRIHHLFSRNQHQVPYLTYEWMAKDGKGYVKNYLPGGRELVTDFSRFTDEDGEMDSKGTLVGGGLPEDVRDDDRVKMNKTGMTYFDGTRWFHIWCTVNEAMFSVESRSPIYPSEWKFLGSKVLNASEKKVTIWSRHIITVDKVPLQMDREVHFTAGEPYFILTLKITNLSKQFAHFIYAYGDEPWLGNYGTSGGNVGWVRNSLVQRVGQVDSSKYHYAGMFDYGNDLLKEGHDFTRMASFLQWHSEEEPILFFANSELETASGQHNQPLSGNSRYIGVQWEKINMLPGETVSYQLAIGMAGLNKTGFPVKPPTPLDSGSNPDGGR
jgi:hypothetical protein